MSQGVDNWGSLISVPLPLRVQNPLNRYGPSSFPSNSCLRFSRPFHRCLPKGVFGKGVGNSQNASEMRQKCVKMGLVLLGKEERPKCVRNPSRFCVAQAMCSPGIALRIHLSYLAGLAGASLRQAFGLPQREGACLALTTLLSHTGFVCGGRLRQAFVCPRGSVQTWGNGRR